MPTLQERATVRPSDRLDEALPSPVASRLRRPGWRDPRLLLGVALVGVSVALGAWAVGTAGRTVPVLVARDVIVPGDAVTVEDLEVREVRLGTATDAYLRPGEVAGPLLATRTVGAGELVPRAALVTEAQSGLRAVAVTPRGPVSRDVVPGALVELWLVPAAQEDAEEVMPRLLVDAATVAEVAEPTGAFTAGGSVSVHVLVPVESLPDVLGATASGGTIEVVPLPGPTEDR